MPSSHPQLTLPDVAAIVRLAAEPAGTGRVGLELEWLTATDRWATCEADFDTVRSVTAQLPLPGGSTVQFEPGGQLELSGPPLPGPAAACGSMAADVRVLSDALADSGVRLVALGLAPDRLPRRVHDTPRYRAMEAFFDDAGPEGREMMCSTAAVQVNVDLGAGAHADRHWRLAHALGPTLLAAFAHSPLRRGRATGWLSTRTAVWADLDPTRTRPALHAGRLDDWVAYALDARVMLIRAEGQGFVPLHTHLTLARWVEVGHELGWPTADDVEYHLTTLFPPVRPRGWLELRYLDAVPDPWWAVATAVVVVLLHDEEAAAAATEATRGTEGLWREAAIHGLAHPGLAFAARACFAAALAALPRAGVEGALTEDCAAFFERYVARGRSPAHDALASWRHCAAGAGLGGRRTPA